MIKIKQGILNRAIEEANQSNYHYKMGAVVFSGKRIISSGRNHAHRWSGRVNPIYKKWPTSIHAEVAAILNARVDLKGSSILIVRINEKNDLRLAKPCSHCLSYLNYCGINKIIYSVKDGFEEIRL